MVQKENRLEASMAGSAACSKAVGGRDYHALLRGYYYGMQQGVAKTPQSSEMEQFISELRLLVQEDSRRSDRRVA